MDDEQVKPKHAGGRPTKYDPSLMEKVENYLATTGKEKMELPTMQGLALYLGVNGDTLVEWGKQHEEFSASLSKLMARQAKQLINDGIYGGKDVNATIIKLLLQNNHGMKERQDLTTDDQKIEGPVVYLPEERK